MGEQLELKAARERARAWYEARLEAILDEQPRNQALHKVRNRIRKIKTAKGIRRLEGDARLYWDWFEEHLHGFRDWPLELQVKEVMDFGPGASRPRYLALEAFARPLFQWWLANEAAGKSITSGLHTKTSAPDKDEEGSLDGDDYSPSPAVEFLGKQIAWLKGYDLPERGDLRSANTVTERFVGISDPAELAEVT